MKKIVYVIVLILMTGCTSKKIMVENPILINYNNTNMVEKDYEEIINILSTIKFSCGKSRDCHGNTLTITTDKTIYKFHISSNYYMGFQENDKYCYTTDTIKVENLIQTLDTIIHNYEDISYFTIRNEINYAINEDESFIKLDRKENYIIINSLYPLYDFKINQIEYHNENNIYTEVDLLYSNDFLAENKNIVIRKEILAIPNFKISFKNKYNYLITILPFYNNNNEVNFITEIKK